MRRLAAALMLTLTLVACGIDGPPQAPTDTPEPGLDVSGQVKIGISGS